MKKTGKIFSGMRQYIALCADMRQRPIRGGRPSRSKKLTAKQSDKGYEDWLSEIELNNLKILFQKRHILVHNEGIVDDKYIKRSGDSTYKIGQRIVVTASDIHRLVDLIGKLAAEIRTVAGE